MKTIKQLMQQHAGKWPADPRAPAKRTYRDTNVIVRTLSDYLPPKVRS